MRRLVTRLRRRAAENDGTVLLIVALIMTALLASGAVAIDLGTARAARTKAQTAADAAALAVSDAASEGTTSAAALQTVAQDMVADNAPGQTVAVSTTVNGSTTSYRVVVSGNTEGTLAAAIGSASPRVSAAAVAAVATTVTGSTSTSYIPTTITSSQTGTTSVTSTTYAPCSTVADAGCFAVYASDSDCSVDSYTSDSGSNAIDGAVVSDGSLQAGGGSNAFLGPVYYSNAPGCSASSSGGSNAYNGGGPTARAPVTGWPVDYTQDFPSCSGSTCSGQHSTPSFCTQVSTSSSTWDVSPTANNIYCALGTGTASNPSTWNGSIEVTGSAWDVSFVGGSVTEQGGGIKLSACGVALPTSSGSQPQYSTSGYVAGDCSSAVPAPITLYYPLFYMTGTGVPITLGGGSSWFDGDSFAPNGEIDDTAGSNVSWFLEGLIVGLDAGSDAVYSTGPQINGTTSTSKQTTVTTSTSVSTSTSTSVTSTTQTLTGQSALTG